MSKPTLNCFQNAIFNSYKALGKSWSIHCLLSFLALAPFCFFGILGMFRPYFKISSSLNALPENYFLAALIFIFSSFIWIIPCGVLWHRLYLKGSINFTDKKLWKIFLRSSSMITYSLILLGMTLIITIVFLFIAYYIFGHAGHMGLVKAAEYYSDTGKIPYPAAIWCIAIFVIYFLIRFSLAFSGRAVGCDTGFFKSLQLTKDKGILMFAAHLLTTAPITLMIYGIYSLANDNLNLSIIFNSAEGLSAGYIVIFITAPIIMLPIAMVSAITSHFYHYCDAGYQSVPEEEEEEEEIAKSKN